MIDIHTHILPEIDDGSQSMETSLEMLRIAVACGTTHIILTPHCNPMFGNLYGESLKDDFSKLCEAATDIPIKLYLGMENYGDKNLINRIREKKSISLNFSRYFAVEFSFSEKTNPQWISSVLWNMLSMGITPVVVHPERYPYVINNPQLVYKWVSMGCLVQINSTSLTADMKSKKFYTAIKLLRHRLVHFCASDSHNVIGRSPDLRGGKYVIDNLISPDYSHLLFATNPQAVIEDKKIIIPPPVLF